MVCGGQPVSHGRSGQPRPVCASGKRRGTELVASVLAIIGLMTSCTVGDEGKARVNLDTDRGDSASSLDPARLTARPARPAKRGGVGLHVLERGTRTPTRLFVPTGYSPRRPAPLLLALHGAGGNGGRIIHPLRDFAREIGALLLAPKSAGSSWDLMRRGFGPDVRAIDSALGYVFNRFAIDPERVATYGFSDGASYALSLGIANGDLFESVVALSPGGVSPGTPHGRPRIFITHGAKDAALPIEATSALIVPRLRDAGYQVTFRRHPGAHEIGPGLDAALTWLADEWGRLPPSNP